MSLLHGIIHDEPIGNVTVTNVTLSIYVNKHAAIRATVGATCFLSMIGALFVAFSYLCYRDLRSQARQILFNLSLMDFGVGLANLSGIAIYFDRYYIDLHTGIRLVPPIFIVYLCKAQAFIAFFSTYASIFWTITLAVYMYFLIYQDLQQKKKGVGCCFLSFCYVLNYGLAGGLSLWFLLTKRLGHSIYGSTGWCTIIVMEPNHKFDYITVIIGYDLWIYLAIILCTTIYVSIFIYLNFKVR